MSTDSAGGGACGPAQITARRTIPFVDEISGTWEPADAERSAAWELYLETVTQVSVEELAASEGFLREALSSPYTFVFIGTPARCSAAKTEIASPMPPATSVSASSWSPYSTTSCVPLLTSWHPHLSSYESRRP